MKKFKAVLAAAAGSSLIIAALAYTTHTKKPTATVTYYYDCSIGLTRGAIIPGNQILIQSEIKTAANWTTTVQAGGSGAYLNSITFDQEPGDVSDGITDGQYSLQEAIDAVAAEYIRSSQYNLPTNGNCFTPPVTGASAICIGRATSNSCP